MPFRTSLLLTLLILISSDCFCQDDQLDSLVNLVQSSPDDTGKVNTLNLISKKYFNSDPDKAITYGQQAAELATKLNFNIGLALANKNIGIGYFYKGNYIEALKFYELSLSAYQLIGNKKGVANIYSNMGNIYYNQGADEKALELYLNSLKFAEEIKDTLRMVTALINVGAIYGKKKQTYDKAISFYHSAFPLSIGLKDNSTIGITAVNLGEVYMLRNDYDSALHYYTISLKAVEGTEDAPYTMNDMGSLYMLQKNYDKAIEIQQQAYDLAKELGATSDMSISLVGLAQSYQAKGELKNAIHTFKEAEGIAAELNSNYTLRDVYRGLSEVYTTMKDFPNASMYQSLLLAIKDSIYDLESDKKLGTLQFAFDLEKKESQINLLTKDQEIKAKEISRQKLMRNGFIGGFTIVLVFAGIFFIQRNSISIAKKRSDELLLNILPEEVAEELKAKGSADAKHFDNATVMFTDFKGFTQISEKLTPSELVIEIHTCFKAFDDIIGKHNIEKIKTIGDSYMCAGGLPVPNATNATDVVNAAMEIQQFMRQHLEQRKSEGKDPFEIRIGIHTGPVVAGIVGVKKFAYDIWGDTVNIASRMESSGEVGKINISGATYELVKDKFTCIHRGKVVAKNKGEIDMYFVQRPN